ncbi:hypothetical protein B0H11DRAFT_1941031 [Mycena galericulata]|nr:hypothetical protein B0H11DRAFT_1941031 [Mycena galericulata]
MDNRGKHPEGWRYRRYRRSDRNRRRSHGDDPEVPEVPEAWEHSSQYLEAHGGAPESAEGWNVSRESLEEEQMTTESIVGKGRRAGGRNGPRWKNMMELVMFRKGRTGPEQGGCVGEAGTSGYCRECGRWKGV